jgi:hypothetical protein
MEVNTSLAVAALLVLGIALFFIFNCKKHEKYTRTTLTGLPNSRFIRTPVDSAAKATGSIMDDPHYRADPGTKNQPVELGHVDFFPDQRRLAEGTLYQEFGNTYLAGTGEPFIPNDTKTRVLLKELGDMSVARKLENTPLPGQDPSLAPVITEETIAEQLYRSNPFASTIPNIGGQDYFFRDQPGMF